MLYTKVKYLNKETKEVKRENLVFKNGRFYVETERNVFRNPLFCMPREIVDRVIEKLFQGLSSETFETSKFIVDFFEY